jgi:threonyl-tRNA synthetase
MVNDMYKKLGLDYSLNYGSRPEGYFGDSKKWSSLEKLMQSALESFNSKYGVQFNEEKGGGEYCGPQIQVIVKLPGGMQFVCGHLMIDMFLPLRFQLNYFEENEKKIPFIIHQSIYGSVERIMAIILEQYQAQLPFWLSPRQVLLKQNSNKGEEAVIRISKELSLMGVSVDCFKEDEMDKKVCLHYFFTVCVEENGLCHIGSEIDCNLPEKLEEKEFLALIKSNLVEKYK